MRSCPPAPPVSSVLVFAAAVGVGAVSRGGLGELKDISGSGGVISRICGGVGVGVVVVVVGGVIVGGGVGVGALSSTMFCGGLGDLSGRSGGGVDGGGGGVLGGGGGVSCMDISLPKLHEMRPLEWPMASHLFSMVFEKKLKTSAKKS